MLLILGSAVEVAILVRIGTASAARGPSFASAIKAFSFACLSSPQRSRKRRTTPKFTVTRAILPRRYSSVHPRGPTRMRRRGEAARADSLTHIRHEYHT